MKPFLITLVLIAACVVGLGFYRGWFHLGSENSGDKSDVTLSVDKGKMQEDEKKAVAKVEDLGNKAKEKAAGPGAENMDGKVVGVSGDKLTMTNKEGKEHSHTLAANVKVTCDGKACTTADLKAGMRVRVTTENAEPHAATRIEALDNNRDFEKGA